MYRWNRAAPWSDEVAGGGRRWTPDTRRPPPAPPEAMSRWMGAAVAQEEMMSSAREEARSRATGGGSGATGGKVVGGGMGGGEVEGEWGGRRCERSTSAQNENLGIFFPPKRLRHGQKYLWRGWRQQCPRHRYSRPCLSRFGVKNYFFLYFSCNLERRFVLLFLLCSFSFVIFFCNLQKE